VPVIFDDDEKILTEAKWGLNAKWSTHPLFNARAESIDIKPSFKKDFEERRCLMIADSFYEWTPKKRPYRVFLKGEAPFAFAAIYSQEGDTRTCAMITTSSNALVSKVHDRMPVILPRSDEFEYLHAEAEDAKEILLPYPADKMDMYEITNLVNNARNDSPDVMKPKTSKGTLFEYMER
jgi:putative SOS response-associated peptidase YedK